MPSLTLYFIIEPPKYLYMACHLAASIRCHLPPDVELIGYCPAETYDQMSKEPLEVLRRLRCKVVRMETDGVFETPYPHGNKLIAALAPKDTEFSAFLDSDMAFLRQCEVEELTAVGEVGVVPSTSMRWADQSIWDDIYGAFDMGLPSERITMTRDKRKDVLPYFNAGLIVIDETYRTPEGKRFAEVWMETAQTLDALSFIPHKRPYLDQMSLPVAIQRAGMSWNILPERYNYSIGGILRGKKLSKDADVTLLHYRNRDVLGDAGRKKDLDKMLYDQLGTRLVRWVFDVPEDRSLPLKYMSDKEPVQTGTTMVLPDPSKATMAAMTYWDGDEVRLRRWLGYYGQELGQQNLYILSSRNGDLIKQIAPEVSVIPIPDTVGHDAIWAAMGSFASGLTLYHNWVLCVEADEFLLADPLKAQTLNLYLSQSTATGLVPRVSMPLGFEVVGNLSDGPVYARQTRDVQKPCITRSRIAYGSNGAHSNVKSFSVDPHLCLIKVPTMASKPRTETPMPSLAPATLDLPDDRKALVAQKTATDAGLWTTRPRDADQVYRLPARFRDKLAAIMAVGGAS